MTRPLTAACHQRTHGIASARKGCPCDLCAEAKRLHGKRYRLASYVRRQREAGMEMCSMCSCWFHPKGLAHHEYTCEG